MSNSRFIKLDEVMPDIFLGCNDIEKLTWEYFNDEYQCLKKRYTFFGFPSSEKEIFALVSNAASFEQVEDCINNAYARGEKHLLNTLVAAREIAIQHLDINIQVANGNVIAGMAEKIAFLGKKLYGSEFEDKVKSTILVLPIENPDQKKEREKVNVSAVNEVFYAIQKNDKNIATAIEYFKKFVRNSDINPINRLHLLYVAFQVLSEKGGMLPSINSHDSGGRYGKLADLFCFNVIGDVIQSGIKPRVFQIIKAGVLYMSQGQFKVDRSLNVENTSNIFLLLADNSYYDDTRLITISDNATCVRGGDRCYTSYKNLWEAMTDGIMYYASGIDAKVMKL